MKVENPQLGKHYLLYREGTFLKEVRLVDMDNLYYYVLPPDDDFDEEAYFDASILLNYAKNKYYLTECNHSKNKEDELEPAAQETQATKLQLLTEDFLQKSREVKEMAAELKKYLDEQTKKLIQDMTNHASEICNESWNFSGNIINWSVTHYWNGGLFLSKLYTRNDALMNATPKIIEQWRALCELKVKVDKFV